MSLQRIHRPTIHSSNNRKTSPQVPLFAGVPPVFSPGNSFLPSPAPHSHFSQASQVELNAREAPRSDGPGLEPGRPGLVPTHPHPGLRASHKLPYQVVRNRGLRRDFGKPVATRTALPASLPLHTQLASGQAGTSPNGLPDRLKAGIENLSGFSMDHVRVYYNSSTPTRLSAHAYARGMEIHIGPGQRHKLPHEAWHVVQQKQGRVRPNLTLRGIPINYSSGLEHEAEVMGAKAERASKTAPIPVRHVPVPVPVSYRGVVQGSFFSCPFCKRRKEPVHDTGVNEQPVRQREGENTTPREAGGNELSIQQPEGESTALREAGGNESVILQPEEETALGQAGRDKDYIGSLKRNIKDLGLRDQARKNAVDLASRPRLTIRARNAALLALIPDRGLEYLEELATMVGSEKNEGVMGNVRILTQLNIALDPRDITTLARTPGRDANYVSELAALRQTALQANRSVGDLVVLGDKNYDFSLDDVRVYLGSPAGFTGEGIARLATHLRQDMDAASVVRLISPLAPIGEKALSSIISAVPATTLDTVSQGGSEESSFATSVRALLATDWAVDDVIAVLQAYGEQQNQQHRPVPDMFCRLLLIAGQKGLTAARVQSTFEVMRNNVAVRDDRWGFVFQQFNNFLQASHKQPEWAAGTGGNVLRYWDSDYDVPGGNRIKVVVQLRAERLNHFNQGHTYEHFKFAEGNIDRMGSPYSFWPRSTRVDTKLNEELANGFPQKAYEAAETSQRQDAGYISFLPDNPRPGGPQGQNTKYLMVDKYFPRGVQKEVDIYTAELRIIGKLLNYDV